MVVNWKDNGVTFGEISNALESTFEHLKLIRLDRGPDASTAVLLAIPPKDVALDVIIGKIHELDANADVSFYEAKTNW